MREGWMADRRYSGVTVIVWIRISNAEHRIEHSACPLLLLKGEHRRRWRVLGGVLDIIDADRFVWSRPRDEGPIRLLHHQRRPAVVVATSQMTR